MRGEKPCLAYKSISAKRAALTLGVDWKELFEKKLNAKKLKGVEYVNDSGFYYEDTFCIAGFDEETTKKIEEYVIRSGYKIEAPENVHLMSMDHLVINEFAEKIPEEYEMWLNKKSWGHEYMPGVITLETLCGGFNWSFDLYWEI